MEDTYCTVSLFSKDLRRDVGFRGLWRATLSRGCCEVVDTVKSWILWVHAPLAALLRFELIVAAPRPLPLLLQHG